MTTNTPIPTEGPSRRRFLQLGALGAASIGIAACGGSSTSASGSAITLSLTSDLTEMMKAPLAAFQKAHNAKVNLRIMPSDTGQYFDAIRTQFQAGSTSIDVIAGDISWPAQLASNGWIKDLSSRFTPEMRRPYLPATIQANTFKQKIFGLPWYTDSGFLYYRKDLLDKSGFGDPPKTWGELQGMAAKVQHDSGTRYGYVFQGAQYEGGTVNGLEFIRTAGGDVLDASGRIVIGDAAAVNGLKIQRAMVTDGTSPAAVAEYKEDESAGAFLAGDSVFLRSWGYLYGLVSDPSQSKITNAQVGVGELPVADAEFPRVNVGGGWNFYMNAGTHNPDLAWALMKFISAQRQQKIWAIKGSLLPTRLSVYADTAVQKAMPVVKAGATVVPETTTPPASPYYADMSLAMAKHFNASLRGAETPDQAAQALQGELQSIVDKS
jgi:multiple sugar transport system substrate-binding protein